MQSHKNLKKEKKVRMKIVKKRANQILVKMKKRMKIKKTREEI